MIGDDYDSIAARIVGFDTGLASDVLVDLFTLGFLLLFVVLFVLVR